MLTSSCQVRLRYRLRWWTAGLEIAYRLSNPFRPCTTPFALGYHSFKLTMILGRHWSRLWTSRVAQIFIQGGS